MTFIVKTENNKRYNEAVFKNIARNYIVVAYKRFGATEKLLNNYLIEKYKISLLTACFKIINNAKYSFNGNNEMIISFPKKIIENLVNTITFGTGGKIQGSNILKLAFCHEN